MRVPAEARLALADSIMGGIALMFDLFPVLANNVTKAAFFHIIPVGSVMMLWARLAVRPTRGCAVFGHKGPSGALLACDVFPSLLVCPLVGWGKCAGPFQD